MKTIKVMRDGRLATAEELQCAVDGKPSIGSASAFDLLDALKELNRHIEALEQIGGCGVTSSVTQARYERAKIVHALARETPNDKLSGATKDL